MNKSLKNFIWLSNMVGRDQELAVGTGGNTSGKTDDRSGMYIKASGSSLSEVSENRGWREVDTQEVIDLMSDPELLAMTPTDREVAMAHRLVEVCIDDMGDNPRPSTESTLHAFMGNYGVHLHALSSLVYVCAKNGKQTVEELFEGKMVKPLWVPYSNPGFDLGFTVKKYYDEYIEENSIPPEVMFLEKHGLMVCSDDAEKTLHLTKKAMKICREGFGKIPDVLQNPPEQELIDTTKETIRQEYENVAEKAIALHFYITPVVELYFNNNDARKSVLAGAIIPDEIGFMDNPVFIDYPELINLKKILEEKINTTGKLPTIVFVNNVGVFIAGDKKFSEIVKEVFLTSLYVRYFSFRLGGINVLTEQQQQFVKNWEGEKYRVKQANSNE